MNPEPELTDYNKEQLKKYTKLSLDELKELEAKNRQRYSNFKLQLSKQHLRKDERLEMLNKNKTNQEEYELIKIAKRIVRHNENDRQR